MKSKYCFQKMQIPYWKKNMLRRTRIYVNYHDRLSVNIVLFADRLSFSAKMKNFLVLLVMLSLCSNLIWIFYYIWKNKYEPLICFKLHCRYWNVSRFVMSYLSLNNKYVYQNTMSIENICLETFLTEIEIKWFY